MSISLYSARDVQELMFNIMLTTLQKTQQINFIFKLKRIITCSKIGDDVGLAIASIRKLTGLQR